MNDPHDLPRRLAAVRNAWRRTAVLAGCAVAAVEAVGVIVLFLVIDLVFVSTASAHTILATLTWTAVAALFAWHGIRPLLRPISDREIALFIEERNPEFRGSLLTAIEFSGQGISGPQAELVSLAVARAIGEAGARNPVSAVRLVALRKYVIAACCLALGWLVTLLAVPASVNHRIVAALNPLSDPTVPLGPDGKPIDPAVAAVLARLGQAEQTVTELRLELDPAEASFRVKRGEALQLTVVCSRRPDSQPRILVRSQADAAATWRAIDMQPVERANGFGGTISDISEELVFCVAAGDVRSAEHTIAVFDPLTITGIAATLTPPAYLGGTPTELAAPDGDLTMPEGGSAVLRFTANRPLAKGELRWADGPVVAGSIDKDGSLLLAVAAPDGVLNAAFTWSVKDTDGAELVSLRPARVQIEPDRAPTIDLESPTQPVAVSARGEVPVRIRAWDDHGLRATTLTWTRHDPEGKPVAQGTIAMAPVVAVPQPADQTKPKADPEPPGTVHLEGAIALETFDPAPRPHDVIIWSVATSDARQQISTTALSVVSIQDYEQWRVWQYLPPVAGGSAPQGGDLKEVLDATWDVLRERDARRLKPAEIPARCSAIAKQMESGKDQEAPPKAGAALLSYLPFPPPPPAWTAAQSELQRRVDPLVKSVHQLLIAGEAVQAKDLLQVGVALIEAYRLTDTAANEVSGEMFMAEAAAAAGAAPDQAKLTLEAARLEAQKAALEEQAKRDLELRLANAATEAMRRLAAVKREHDLVQEQIVALGARPVEELAAPAAAASAREGKLAERTRGIADYMAAESAFKDTPLMTLPAGLNLAETAMRHATAALINGADGLKDASHQAKIADQALNEVMLALKQFSLDAMSESLEATEQKLADALARQRELIDRGRVLAAITGEADLAAQRETTAVAATQARLKGETDALVLAAEGLPKVIESWAASDVLRQVEIALKALRSGRPGSKMVNSIIELQQAHPAQAVTQQVLAEKSLAEAHAAIREALALVARDRAALMEQIKKELDQTKADLESVKPPAAKNDAKGDSKAGKAPAGTTDAPADPDKANADAKAKQADADKAKAEADKAKADADKAKADANAKQADADKAKADAKAKQDQADKAKADADAKPDAQSKQAATDKQADADKAKADAKGKQDQADKAKADAAAKQAAADKAKAGADTKQAAADKAKADAEAKAKQDQAKAGDPSKATPDASAKAKADAEAKAKQDHADKAMADADKAKAGADKAKADADKAKADANAKQADADKAKADAKGKQDQADKAKADAKAKSDAKGTPDADAMADAKAKQDQADKAKADADAKQAAADKAKADAKGKQDQADKAKAGADKAKADADKSKADADKAKADADKSDGSKGGSAKPDPVADAAAKAKADKAKADTKGKQDQADKAGSDAKAKQDQADKAKADAKAKQDDADKAKADATGKGGAAPDAKAAADAKAKQDDADKSKADAKGKQDLADKAKADAKAKQDAADKAKKDAQDGDPAQGGVANADAHRAAERLKNLAQLLDKAGIDAKDLKDLGTDAQTLAKRLAIDPSAKEDALRIVDRLSRAVAQEVASTADSSRILSGSRGEVPPQYRALVNRYFEIMSRHGQGQGGTAP